MSELLIIAHDKVGSDAFKDAKCYKRGDVVVIMPDGHEWGSAELTNPLFRILRLPNISEAEASAMLLPEIDTDPAHPSRVLQRRKIRLDLSNVTIPQALLNWIADDARTVPAFSSNVSVAFFRGLKATKPPLVDPDVLS